MILRGAFIIFFACISFACFAQDDDLMQLDSAKKDTLNRPILRNGKKVITVDSVQITTDKPVKEIPSYAKRFNPRRASLYAMVLPGAGQIYTKKYWKAPFVWGGFGILVYAVSFSQTQWAYFNFELYQMGNSPTYRSPEGYSSSVVSTIVTEYRRQRDYFLILNFFWYVLQIVDAHVDAHLKEFDLNPNLQVKIETIPMQYSAMPGAGLTLSYKF